MLRRSFTIRQDRFPSQKKLGAPVPLAKTFLGHTVSTTMKSVLATVSTTVKFASLKTVSRKSNLEFCQTAPLSIR